VAAGAHVVVFTFRSRWLASGAVVTALALMALGLAAARRRATR
jgi:hypothetical protein